METKVLDKWEPMARAIPEPIPGLRAPIAVMIGEALDVARFCQHNWKPQKHADGSLVLPGMQEALGNGTFSENIVEELLELRTALVEAQGRYQMAIQQAGGLLATKARYVIGEIRSTLEWYLDDDVEDVRDAQLAKVNASHENAYSQDALAAALYDYAFLAEENLDGIKGVGGFSPALIQEARDLALQLNEVSAGSATPEPTPAETEALELRNRIGVLLYGRMLKVRKAARYVYRHHPDAIRKVTSAYARRQRSLHRQQEDAESEAAADAEKKTEAEPVVAPV